MSIRVESVDPGSTAAALGLAPGDELLTADGNVLNDMLDYQFYTDSARFVLRARCGGAERTFCVEKDEYTPFGCNFTTYLADAKHSCANHCMFCFIEQLPQGLRKSLYFKDDDERLSFLFGNYITMTNMAEHEIDRIIRMHISPVNISVHTTNPALRDRMMDSRRGGETLRWLPRLADAGIELNCQLVLCRGINDGDELRRTLDDLLALGPSVRSIAAVPAGLTRYRSGLYPLTAYDAASAAAVLDILEERGARQKRETGRRVVFPGDEWYLCAGRPIPAADFYEEYAQLENGVGMWRLFREEFLAELARPHRVYGSKAIDIVTGTLAAPLLAEMAGELHRQYPMISVYVHAVRNDFFGGNVSVAGLVTGTDILAQCRGRLGSGVLGIPEVMLRAEKDLFLDGKTPQELGDALGVKAEILPAGGGDTAKALLRSGLHLARRPKNA